MEQMFSNHSYSDFTNFIYDNTLVSGPCIKDDSFNQSLNHDVSDSYFITTVSYLITDILFNNNSTFNFINHSNHGLSDVHKVSEQIKSDVVSYRYCLLSDAVSVYVMDCSEFNLSRMDKIYKLGQISNTQLYHAKLDDLVDESRILLFNDKINFRYNKVRSGSKTNLYYNIDLSEFKNDSEVVHYILSDSVGNRLRAKWRKFKLNKFKEND